MEIRPPFNSKSLRSDFSQVFFSPPLFSFELIGDYIVTVETTASHKRDKELAKKHKNCSNFWMTYLSLALSLSLDDFPFCSCPSDPPPTTRFYPEKRNILNVNNREAHVHA